MVILDLRLLASEENEDEYENFISIKLLQWALSAKSDELDPLNPKYVFPKLKFILSTASNQIQNMLSAINKNIYIPHRIFIKEGFDISFSFNQSLSNYNKFLECLLHTANARYRSNPKKLETFIELEQKRIDSFESENWKSISKEFIEENEFLLDYTHIILDTNIFLNPKSNFPISGSPIIMTYPVKKELERISNTRESSFRSYLAKVMLDEYEDDSSFLSDDIIKKIDKEIKKKNFKELADNYFIEIIEFYLEKAEEDCKILFVSNDSVKKSNNRQDSPLLQLNKWKQNNNIKNVDILQYYDLRGEIKLIDPFIQAKTKKEKSNTNNKSKTFKAVETENRFSIKECLFENKMVQIEVDASFHPHWCRVKNSNGDYFGAILKAKVENNVNNLIKGKTKAKNGKPARSIISLYKKELQVLIPKKN
jgi:hypothetical protein